MHLPAESHRTPRSRRRVGMPGRVLFAVVAAIALVTAACGDDDGGLSGTERAALVAEITEDGAINESQANCLIDELINSIGVDGVRALSEGDDEEFDEAGATAVFAAFAACDIDLFGGGFDDTGDGSFDSGADSYGDDPTLDALWDACEGGDGEACDNLYFRSPIGSEYETFGDTCGGRFPAGTVLCADEL